MKITKKIIILSVIILTFCSISWSEVIEGIAIKVNEDIITLSEFNAMWVPYVQAKISNKDLQKNQLIKLLIQWQIFEQMAYEKGISITNAEVERALEERFAQEGIQGWDEFMTMMQQNGILSKELALRQHKLALLSQRFLMYLRYNNDPEFKIDNVNDNDIKKAYKENLKSYMGQERRKIRHILIKKSDDMDDQTYAKKRELAETIGKKAQSDYNFTDLVNKYSEDQLSRSKGGVLGEFTREKLEEFDTKIDSDIAKVVFSLNENEVSDVVESKLGFHIIQVIKIIKPDEKDFNDMREEIKLKLEEQRYLKKMQDVLEKKVKNARIVILVD